MKVSESIVKKICITEIEGLDPVTVFLEDFEPGKGSITIKCYSNSWTSFWGAMSDKSISEFFVSCDNHYLAKNLMPSLEMTVVDMDKFINNSKSEILRLRKERDITKQEALSLWVSLDEVYTGDDDAIHENGELYEEIWGCEWWNLLPYKDSHDCVYLYRVIDAVREALKS